ncbi:radical SAM protein [Sulfurimonas sp. HSL-3221]|uniref:radical SAM protein n=1 Tax=Thiomicrolovo sulfuroxydans TaxID=2894755 RepID=UPI001E485DF1|nr:radical SAM protein [Sulfurimonas sp. HSL-3221]UFS62198.1 radical SAM protein [Sulfurimonas sp. HSL-3221]
MSAIFGPVNSRRFGTSLGIDLSPGLKQCNFDCLYCELAPAAPVTEQKQRSGVDEIIAELRSALAEHPGIDDITVTANGEPTLYPELDALVDRIDAVKGNTKTLILTNSATLTDPKTFATLLKFDQVKLSLDAVTPEVFRKIDRPAEGIEIDALVDAVKRFAAAYRGDLYLEILFVHGLNDTDEEIASLDAVLHDIPCKRVDIGTIDRPPAYPVQGLSYGELHEVASKFAPDLPIHIASRTHAESCQGRYSDDAILNTLDKRPLSMEDIALLFDNDSRERFQALVETGLIVAEDSSGITFYMPAKNLHRKRAKNP